MSALVSAHHTNAHSSHRKLRTSDHGILLLNVCFALLGVYISFILAGHVSQVPPLCALVSLLLHYFLLVTFLIMSAEAVNLYMKLVVVLGNQIAYYSLKATVTCWGKHLPSVVIPVS